MISVQTRESVHEMHVAKLNSIVEELQQRLLDNEYEMSSARTSERISAEEQNLTSFVEREQMCCQNATVRAGHL